MFCLCTMSWSIASSNQQIIPIRIINGGKLENKTHRAPVYIPIQALFDDEDSSITLLFLQDIGEVSISIYNEETGYCVNFDMNTNEEWINIPIIQDKGIIVVTITCLESLLEYSGELHIV